MPSGAPRRAGALAPALCLLAAAALATAATVQQGNLRITVQSLVQPYKLPRTGTAPIAVFVSGHIGTADRTLPPQLMKMTVLVNRHGLLRSEGLAVCPLARIQPASTERALKACAPALVGSGQFWASIVLPDQGAYPTHGRLLIFNGRRHGHPTLLAQIYTQDPFNASFVVVFSIHRLHRGTWGTELAASFPQALGDWGFVDRIKLTLRRKYRYLGRELSYFNAGCPAAPGFAGTTFPLAKASFSFAGGEELSTTINKGCKVKE